MIYSQNVLTRFVAQGQDREMLLSWTLATGRTCNGIEILRSANKEEGYVPIGFIGGVCGSIVDTVSYEFIDAKPNLNQNMFYVLNLAELGYSDTLQAYLAYAPKNEFILYWVPDRNKYQVNFNTNFLSPVNVKILSMNGSLIQENRLASNPDWLDLSSLSPGWYVVRFQDDIGSETNPQLIRVYSQQ